MTTKKKTPTERIIDKAVEKAVTEAAEKLSGNTVTGCSFYGVKWDGKAVSAIQTIADGLHAQANANADNAKAMSDLISVFKSQNIEIEAMLKFVGE